MIKKVYASSGAMVGIKDERSIGPVTKAGGRRHRQTTRPKGGGQLKPEARVSSSFGKSLFKEGK